jgi:hypothetical protein
MADTPGLGVVEDVDGEARRGEEEGVAALAPAEFQDPLHALALELIDGETGGIARFTPEHLRPAGACGLWESSRPAFLSSVAMSDLDLTQHPVGPLAGSAFVRTTEARSSTP